MPVCASVAKLFASLYSGRFFTVYILESGKIGPFPNLAAICQHHNQRYTSLSELPANSSHSWQPSWHTNKCGNNFWWQSLSYSTNAVHVLWLFFTTDSWTERLTAGLRDWQQDWEADSRTERLTAGLRGWQQDWEADSRTERLTAGLRGWQQDWEADSRTERLTAGLRGWQQDWEADSRLERLSILPPTASVNRKIHQCICIYKTSKYLLHNSYTWY